MYKKILTALICVLIATTASANFPFKVNKKTTFELSYNNNSMILKGNYFAESITISPREHLMELSNQNIVNSIINIITAFKIKDFSWLKNNSMGNMAYFDNFIKKYNNLLTEEDINVYGYAFFNQYIIVFLEQKKSEEKFIFVLRNGETSYKIDLDLEKMHPLQYNIFNQSFKGHGEFIVIKK